MYRILVLLALFTCALAILPAATVTGKVVDADGKPVANAQLWLGWMDGTQGQDLRADAQGAFSVTFDDAHENPLAPGVLLAYAPGYALGLGSIYNREVKCITLQSATSLSGTVISEDGKPLAGVTVCDHMQRLAARYPAIPASWRARYTATTDATGRWVLPNVSRDGFIEVTIMDERVAREFQEVTMKQGQPSTPVQLTAHPAGTICGRVLDPDGKPVTDGWVNIFPPTRNTIYKLPVETDGTFRCVSVAPGQYLLRVYSRKNRWVAADVDGISVRAWEVTSVPDVHARTGAILEGDVLDADSGMPIPDADIACFQTQTKATRFELPFSTDEHGHFLCHLLPVTTQVYICNSPQGYCRQTERDAISVELQDGKTTRVALKLAKGFTLTGTAIDVNGKVAANVPFMVNLPNGVGLFVESDKEGHFTVEGLPAGKLSFDIAYDPEQLNEWKIVQSETVTMPAPAPTTILLRHLIPDTVRGRVVDVHQQPLRGVTVSFNVTTELHCTPITFTAVTGDDGYYQLEKIPTGARVSLSSCEKKGYRQIGAGLVLRAGQEEPRDLVMAACNLTVCGLVRTSEGAPVQGAVVISAEVGVEHRAVTDANGAFTLSEQPEGTLHLIAATATGGGLATIADAARDVVITSTPGISAKPCDVPLALSLLDADAKLPQEHRLFRWSNAIRFIADIDLPLANKLATAPDAHPSDGLRAYLLGKLAASDPAQAEKVGAAQLDMIADDTCRIYAAVELGIAMARRNANLAEHCYALAKSSYDRVKHGDSIDYIEGLDCDRYDPSLRIIALAEVLHKTTDLNAMLAQLNAQIKENDDMACCVIGAMLAAAGRVSPEFALTVYDRIDSPRKADQVDAAVCSMAQSDPVAARRLIQLISAKRPNNYCLYRIPLQLTCALGKRDPAAALAAAHELATGDDQSSAQLLAACFQPKAEATKIVHDCFAAEPNVTLQDLAFAVVADPDIARPPCQAYEKRIIATKTIFDDGVNPEWLGYAAAISTIDPLEARLILETEFAHARANVQSDEDEAELMIFPALMMRVDITRARAMFDSMPACEDFRDRFGCEFMRYVLTSPVDRAMSIPF